MILPKVVWHNHVDEICINSGRALSSASNCWQFHCPLICTLLIVRSGSYCVSEAGCVHGSCTPHVMQWF